MSRASKNVYHPHGDANNFQTVEETLDGLDDKVTANEGDITTLQSDVTTLQGDLATAQSDITALQTDGIGGIFSFPDNGTILVWLNSPFACTITSTTTKCTSGTCTATFKINTTTIGGTANSVSTSEQTQNHTTSNVVNAGDDINLTISSNSSCTSMSFQIALTRP